MFPLRKYYEVVGYTFDGGYALCVECAAETKGINEDTPTDDTFSPVFLGDAVYAEFYCDVCLCDLAE